MPRSRCDSLGATVRLSVPVAGDFGAITEVTFRRPTEQDLVALPIDPLEMHPPSSGDGPGVQFTLRLNARVIASWIERLSGQPTEVIRAMSLRDAAACWQVVEPMLRQAARRELMN
jgi:hypothetical protein